jgi:hypothetical protein
MAAALDAILGWQASLEEARGKLRWGGGEETEPGVLTMPFCVLPEDVVDFLLDLDRHGLLRTDYRQHVTRLRPAIDDPAQIETLSATDCLHLLTYHIRTDRFVDGHLARALDRGDLSAILRRLAEIRRR